MKQTKTAAQLTKLRLWKQALSVMLMGAMLMMALGKVGGTNAQGPSSTLMDDFNKTFVASQTVLTSRPKKPVSLVRGQESLRTFDELADSAERYGAARIIIGLRLNSFRVDSELDAAKQVEQRQEIQTAQDDLLTRLESFDVKNIVRYKFIPFVAMQADMAAIRWMKSATAEVESITEDVEHQASLFESLAQVSAPQAYNSGYTGQGQVVAVLDTGVDKNHSFLSGKVVSEACYSTTSSAGGINTFSDCPGGAPSSTAPNSGLPMPSIVDGFDHGTHVAGIAAGRTTNISGVGKDAGIIAIKVFSARQTSQSAPCPPGFQYCATAFTSNWISGLERVYELRTTFNIAAVNMSLGSGASINYCDSENQAGTAAINTLRSANIATVIASGNGAPNSNGVASPACISSAVSVGAVTDGSPDQSGNPTVIDRVTSFSQASPILNLLAPGAGITSSVPNNGSAVKDGTSMAAPHVAGAWAVLKQRVPNATVTQVLNALSSTGVPIFDPRYNLTRPRIKLDAALQALGGGAGCQAAPITVGQTVNGALISSDCPNQGYFNDYYSFSGTQGQQIAVAHESAAFDTYLFLLNSNNQVVAEDDDGGGGTNSRIPPGTAFLTLPATGNYTIVATSFSPGASGNYTLRLLTNTTGTARPVSDFDGDGKTDVAVFRPTGGNWYILQSSNNAVAGQAFGFSTDRIVPGDYDGDGKTDIAVFRNGTWYLQRSTQGFTGVAFGASGDVPVPGDYDGDGKFDVAVFRAGTWYILQSSNGSLRAQQFGNSTDKPVVGDFDGDGRADLAVFRNGTWYIQQSTQGFVGVNFGAAGDRTVPGDYDGDGKTDIAVFRNGTWYLQRSQLGFTGVQFGASGDIPTPGDYDGDGKTDVAVYRGGTWYLQRSQQGFTGVQFGASGDVPTPSAFVQ